MHVAMMAVISARARLRSLSGGARDGGGLAPDVLLLPRFVTVDTTNTLGWESVFLRFHIIRAPPALLGSDPPQQLPPSVANMAASIAAAAAVAAGGRQPPAPHHHSHHNHRQLMMMGLGGTAGGGGGGMLGQLIDSGGLQYGLGAAGQHYYQNMPQAPPMMYNMGQQYR